MPYAIQSDIEDLYGAALLLKIADLDRDGIPDPEVVQKGLRSADEIINAYLSALYTLPLPSTPGVVREMAVDIAVYKIALLRAARTDEMRLRYEDALKLLERISTGKAGLGLTPGEGGEGTPGAIDTGPSKAGRSIKTVRA